MTETPDNVPEVSVVIPTRNRSDLLVEVIESLWKQTFDPGKFEIIVTDNCSTDDTLEVARSLQERSPCAFRYHRMEEDRGPAFSRNKGVEMARGPIIAFTDSDCRADPRWLQLGVAALADQEVAFVTGSVLDKPEQPVKFFTRTNSGVTSEHASYPTCNAMYRREVFLEMGGFDGDLCFCDIFNRVNECADTDLAWRVKEKGYGNVFVPEMTIYHEVETQPWWTWMREPYRLWLAPAIVRRHPAIRDQLLIWGLFFCKENVLFYLMIMGFILGPALHWGFALLAVPFLLWAATAGGVRLSPMGLLKMPARAALLTARQAFMCAGLIYGSVRFRALVL